MWNHLPQILPEFSQFSDICSISRYVIRKRRPRNCVVFPRAISIEPHPIKLTFWMWLCSKSGSWPLFCRPRLWQRWSFGPTAQSCHGHTEFLGVGLATNSCHNMGQKKLRRKKQHKIWLEEFEEFKTWTWCVDSGLWNCEQSHSNWIFWQNGSTDDENSRWQHWRDWVPTPTQEHWSWDHPQHQRLALQLLCSFVSSVCSVVRHKLLVSKHISVSE